MDQAIIDELQTILNGESVLGAQNRARELKEELFKIKKSLSETDDQMAHVDRGLDFVNAILDRARKEKATIAEELDDIAASKKELIAQLEVLTQEEKNIGKAFSTFKEIKVKWDTTVGKEAVKHPEIDVEFNKLVDQFHYNINIYKAIQDHDQKKNQQAKDDVLSKLKVLLEKEPSKEVVNELKLLRKEWDESGALKKELSDQYWAEFKGLLDQLYAKLNVLKEQEKANHSDNQQKKEEIIAYLKEIDYSSLDSAKAWKTKTKKIQAKQEEWNQIGFVPLEVKDILWKDYRSACDAFYNAKRDFFQGQKDLYKANKKEKISLCKLAEDALGQEEDQTELFIKIQKEWKKVGPVHQRDEQFLWHRFQNACNAFFNEKKVAGKALEGQKSEIEQKKIALIDQVKSLSTPTKNDLDELVKTWYALNSVAIKRSKELNAQFFTCLEKYLKDLSIDPQDYEDSLFDDKISIYAAFEDGGQMLDRERKVLIDRISRIEKEVAQYENNLGFFSNVKGENPLLAEALKNIDNGKEHIESLKLKVKKIDASY